MASGSARGGHRNACDGLDAAAGDRFFPENTAKSDHDIEVEVDRYIVWPGQALAYKIGQMKMKSLREEAKRELGERFNIRDFHDALLRHGALPLDVLEQRMRKWMAAKPTSAGRT